MTIQEALAYLHDVSWRGSRPGLSRTRELLRRLGDPQKRLRFVVDGHKIFGTVAHLCDAHSRIIVI